jgi:hypothetical protein
MSAHSVELVVWSTCGNDVAEMSSNRDSSGRNVVVEGFGSSIAVSDFYTVFLSQINASDLGKRWSGQL